MLFDRLLGFLGLTHHFLTLLLGIFQVLFLLLAQSSLGIPTFFLHVFQTSSCRLFGLLLRRLGSPFEHNLLLAAFFPKLPPLSLYLGAPQCGAKEDTCGENRQSGSKKGKV